MSSSTNGNNPFAWLGLLKWSLSYTDGTRPSDPDEQRQRLSDEDRTFLESVMREGIIDENVRMREILTRVTDIMDRWRLESTTTIRAEAKDGDNDNEEEEVEIVNDLLEELRDIVEQIDYARAFAAMKGLPFLVGCACERGGAVGGDDRIVIIPNAIRSTCLGIVATMSQHNPAVQRELLDMGAIKTLSDLYFLEHRHRHETDPNGRIRARIMQAISACVRSHELAENVFCRLEQSKHLMECGLGVEDEGTTTTTTTDATATTTTTTMTTSIPEALQKRTLFFLHALVTSDGSTRERVRMFDACISWIAGQMPALHDDASSPEIREMALAFLRQVLEQRRSVNAILRHKQSLGAVGVRRIASLRALSGEEAEFAAMELEHWEALLLLLARTDADAVDEEADNANNAVPLLLGNGPVDPPHEMIPQ